MSGSDPSAEEGDSPSADEKTEEGAKRLSAALAQLKKDDRNPDRWVEAAEAYVAVGDLRKALKCTEACLKIAAGHEEAMALTARIEEGLRGEEEAEKPAKKEEKAKDVRGRERKAAPPPTPKPEVRPRRESVAWVPEEQRSRFKSEAEALEQLRRELSPASTVICRHCNTLVEVKERWCYGCGREIQKGGRTLEQRAGHSRARLQRNERDRDALFTLGAYHALRGQHPEAMEVLNELSKLDPEYPGLWWLKARVFQHMGNEKAAKVAVGRALKSRA
ncbi:MAG: tetratricopeptide repeat protein [Thermoplasmata archaeon]